MAKTGRPRKPTHLKIIEGNRGRRPLNRDEPEPEKIAPEPPDFLNADAKTEWDRVVPILLNMEVLTVADRPTLVGYCKAWARFVEAERQLEVEPMQFKSPNGYPVINNWWIISKKSQDLMIRYATELGFGPAARTRIKGTASAKTKQETKNPATKYFGR